MKNVIAEMKISLGILKDKETLKKKKKTGKLEDQPRSASELFQKFFKKANSKWEWVDNNKVSFNPRTKDHKWPTWQSPENTPAQWMKTPQGALLWNSALQRMRIWSLKRAWRK